MAILHYGQSPMNITYKVSAAFVVVFCLAISAFGLVMLARQEAALHRDFAVVKIMEAAGAQKAVDAHIARQRSDFLKVIAVFILLGSAAVLVLGRMMAARIDDVIREKLRMEKYLSRSTMQLIERVSDGGQLKLGGERRYVVVLFSDIRGFTQITESSAPEEVVSFLNIYLNLQAEAISQRGGVVDKFVGDEVMAIFTGANAELCAAQAAVEIQSFIEALNAIRGETGKRQASIDAPLRGEV